MESRKRKSGQVSLNAPKAKSISAEVNHTISDYFLLIALNVPKRTKLLPRKSRCGNQTSNMIPFIYMFSECYSMYLLLHLIAPTPRKAVSGQQRLVISVVVWTTSDLHMSPSVHCTVGILFLHRARIVQDRRYLTLKWWHP